MYGGAANQGAETHCKQALHLHRKVETSRGTLHGAAAKAGKLADKAAPEGLYDTLVNLGQIYVIMINFDDRGLPRRPIL